MVTYFNRKDLVSFGNYLLSEKRKSQIVEHNKKLVKQQKIQNPVPIENLLSGVYHADVENWLEEQKKNE